MTTPPASQNSARALLIGVLALGLALIALVLVVTLGKGPSPAPRLTNTPNIGAGSITPIEPGDPVPDFILPASTGGDLSLSDLRGQYVLLYFGYTECPDYCPTTMAKWVQIRQGLDEVTAGNTAFVMISIDPRHDTPEVLAEYLGQFDPDFIGLQANEETLTNLAPSFGLAVNVPSGDATAEATEDAHAGMDMAGHTGEGIPTYLVDHTIASYLIDAEGNLRAVFSPNTPAADMRAYLETIRYADNAS